VLAVGKDSDIVIDGGTGTTMWTALNQHLVSFGDIDGDGGTDLLGTAGFYSCGRVQTLYAGGTGAKLWRHIFADGYVCAFPAGDVQADGVPELAVSVGVSPGSTVLLNGRDGHKLWAVNQDDYYLMPLYQSVDGHGDDFVCYAFTENCHSVLVFDGRGPRLLFTFDPGQNIFQHEAAQFTADDQADLMFTSFAGTVTVVDGSTHKARWSWTR
jgi:hypothetical protein